MEKVIVDKVNASRSINASKVDPLIILDEGREVSGKTREGRKAIQIMTTANLATKISDANYKGRWHMEHVTCCKGIACARIHVNPSLHGSWQMDFPVCISSVAVPSYQPEACRPESEVSSLCRHCHCARS